MTRHCKTIRNHPEEITDKNERKDREKHREIKGSTLFDVFRNDIKKNEDVKELN